ncbi:hypothetical protein K8R61_01950 [bacterium]|nr:hypothetical protein [bacterium]
MWLKFAILMLVAVINIVLGLIIWQRNKNKDKARFYFSLMCISAGLWSIGIGTSLLIRQVNFYLLNAQLFYLFATLIFLFFYFFSIHIIYNYSFRLLNYIVVLFTVFILFIIFSDYFLIGTYLDMYGLHEIENKSLHLLYGLYIFILLFYSYYLLFRKYLKSQGVNKRIILFILITTSIPFVLGIIFDWYLPHINKHYLDWIGPIFVFFMTFSISYLLFKKEVE